MKGEMMTKEIRFPKLWFGFVFAGLFLVVEVVEAIMKPNLTSTVTPLTFCVGLAGIVYWFICIYKIHKILSDITINKYPISPGKAVGYSFVPFYNIYWIFRWPIEMTNFINAISDSKRIKGWVAGLSLFLAMLVYRIDHSCPN